MHYNIMTKTIAFDADDTLWENERFFREAENEFCRIMMRFGKEEDLSSCLFSVETDNMPLYGYGIKAFTLSMIEAAGKIAGRMLTQDDTHAIINIGKSLLQRPVKLYEGVRETLDRLSSGHKLVLATKGDLLDQRRKLEKSGLGKYFSHVEIMPTKTTADYTHLLEKLDIKPCEFTMVGNSVKSDIMPVVELGGYAVHIPAEYTWQHEVPEECFSHPKVRTVNSFRELLCRDSGL